MIGATDSLRGSDQHQPEAEGHVTYSLKFAKQGGLRKKGVAVLNPPLSASLDCRPLLLRRKFEADFSAHAAAPMHFSR